LLDEFARLIKPADGGAQARDRSGSRKVFRQTAKRLLKNHSLPDLLQAVQNYAESEAESEPRFRKGFQSFFGPKLELYRDFLPGTYTDPADPAAREISDAEYAEILRMEDEIAEEEAGNA
jgi:hypothetical protein